MKFEWKYRYVPEGQIEPDKHNRWGIDCYIFVNIDKSAPEYKYLNDLGFKKYMPVKIATITKKNCLPDRCPSLIHNFCVEIPSFWAMGTIGLSNSRYLYSNDIEELKQLTEKEFTNFCNVLKYCKK